MKKILIVAGIVVMVFVAEFITGFGGTGLDIAGSGNLPDTSSYFTQVASRSSKGVVKAAPGRVFSITVANLSSSVRYFQLFDQTSRPGSTSTPKISIPIPASTVASNSYVTLGSEFFAPAMRFSTGIGFAVSSVFGSYSSSSVDPTKLTVQINYE